MTNVLLLGACGLTARQITRCLREQEGVALTLFARNAKRLDRDASPRVRVVEGDAGHLDEVRAAMQGQDVVISALGGDDLGELMEGVVRVMEEQGVRRIIALSAGGIYDELPEPFNMWDRSMVGDTRPTNRRAAEAVTKPALDYTVLRPVWLTNKPTEAVELTQKGETFRGTETSRASLGRFIAELVEHPTRHLKADLGISQPNTDGDRPRAYR